MNLFFFPLHINRQCFSKKGVEESFVWLMSQRLWRRNAQYALTDMPLHCHCSLHSWSWDLFPHLFSLVPFPPILLLFLVDIIKNIVSPKAYNRKA